MDKNLRQQLSDKGYRLTGPRLAVLQVLEQEGQHLSPAEIWQRARNFDSGISRATVYRTLELLAQIGLLRPIYLGERTSHLARIERGHQHLVCLDCGGVLHLDEAVTEDIERYLHEKLNDTIGKHQVQSYLLEIYGHCGQCNGTTSSDSVTTEDKCVVH